METNWNPGSTVLASHNRGPRPASGLYYYALSYYGYRYLDTQLGRWLSKDPIWEAGGTNLYVFNYSQPPNIYDDHGSKPKRKAKELPLTPQQIRDADAQAVLPEDEGGMNPLVLPPLPGSHEYNVSCRTELLVECLPTSELVTCGNEGFIVVGHGEAITGSLVLSYIIAPLESGAEASKKAQSACSICCLPNIVGSSGYCELNKF